MKRLLLEGGAQRSLFTAGVLDGFLDAGISFDEIYGISAGALNAVSYVSGDRGRNLEQMERFTGDENYISFRQWLKSGSAFNWDYIFHVIPEKYLPVDLERFKSSPMKLFAGAYNAETGKTEYFPVRDFSDPEDLKYLQASSSLPVFCRLCLIAGQHYADGGVGDSFALEAFKNDGAKTVLVMTQDITYRKEEERKPGYLPLLYAKYPKLVHDYSERAIRYNNDLIRIEHLEKTGQLFVVRPPKPVRVLRTEKDKAKLRELYREGLEEAGKNAGKIREYLEGQAA